MEFSDIFFLLLGLSLVALGVAAGAGILYLLYIGARKLFGYAKEHPGKFFLYTILAIVFFPLFVIAAIIASLAMGSSSSNDDDDDDRQQKSVPVFKAQRYISSWQTISTSENERQAVMTAEAAQRSMPQYRYRVIEVENGRKTVVWTSG
jgi:uncharacterized membrane protein